MNRRGVSLSALCTTTLLILSCALAFTVAPLRAQPATQSGRRAIRVMTLNVYQGTNLDEVVGSRSYDDFLAAVKLTIDQVRATDPPRRAAMLADLIAEQGPDIVSLQEVAQWLTAGVGQSTTVEFDMLQLILDALRSAGEPYRVVDVLTHAEFGAPGSDGVWVGVRQRIALLAREQDELDFDNIEKRQFSARLTLPLPAPLPPVPVPRGYIQADVTLRGRQFRVIAAHLDPFIPALNLAQARELLGGPAATALPVVIAMDGNSSANPPDSFSGSYEALIAAGFVDAWAIARPHSPGFTCCQDASLASAESQLSRRIDLVLTRGGIRARSANTVLADFEGPLHPLWPSDHAGMSTLLRLPE